ncbi:Required for respiratory growth protein 9 mitochondrial [Madurella fahalii]|uniref:Required for respiratory growth protein 9, mitochondrial n=1 Tax=Madurella fahalii TaxID=1157608 RepID=A0ABQ0G583_9PEZI
MTCACQTAALRIFVKNIAHIHVPARTAASRFSHHQVLSQALYRASTRVASLQRTTSTLPTPSSRSLHTSRSRYDATESAHAAEDHTNGSSKREDAARSAETASRETELPPNITYHTELQGIKMDDIEVGERKSKSDKLIKGGTRKERRMAQRKLMRKEKEREKKKEKREAKKQKRREERMRAKIRKGAAKEDMIGQEEEHATVQEEEHATMQEEEHATMQEEKHATKNQEKHATKFEEDGGKRNEKGKAKGKDKDKDKDRKPPAQPKESWKVQKDALKKKFPEGWNPRKKLSPDAMAGIRALHAQFPAEYTTEVLAEKFEVSPEAIRRILKANWTPTPEEEEKRQKRWFNRGKRVWALWAELGKKPPRKWRAEGVVRDPKWNTPKRRSTGKRRSAEKRYNREAAAQAEWKLSETMLG